MYIIQTINESNNNNIGKQISTCNELMFVLDMPMLLNVVIVPIYSYMLCGYITL